MNKFLVIFALTLLFLFLSVGAASASSLNNTTMQKVTYHAPLTMDNSTVDHSSTTEYNSTSDILDESGCCSILLHVNTGYDVFAFRRDSTYTANQYIQNVKWYGKNATKEYKTTNGYFFHTIIASGGWIVATGGPDVPYLNRQLEYLAGKTAASGRITNSTLNSAYIILKKLGMGHFIIKAPNDDVGIVIYNRGNLKKTLFKMNKGQYVSVPNSPSYYRSGYTSIINPVSSVIALATTDRWGINRRNIITYEVKNVNSTTQIKIWASTCRWTPDNIIFLGKIISKYSIPKIPSKKYIGQVILR